MKQNMDCVGFDAPESMVHFMSNCLSELQHLSPCDSYVDAIVEKEREMYSVTISIKHSSGEFSTKAGGADLKSAILQASQNIVDQIEIWRKNRFVDITPDPEIDSPAPSKRLQVLVADDDVESIAPLWSYLKKLNCNVRVVSTGYAAIHELTSREKDYDLLILDWFMPDMNGRQTLLNAQKAISHNPSICDNWKNDRLPVITFSGNERDEIDLPPCENFHFLEHWEKATVPSQLFEKVSKAFTYLGGKDN